ncbi:galactose-1-phosphate uridylyltransferase domain protein [Clostridioides difficile P33]|uniref:galactose-1-phosphate uridylyltransferase domain protein n=1 Tax=Clostridioides difficile TaxID=1496 RepID=UPI0003B17D36|nr:galactose-1-phosphate uridylyltransferase domain protein [Clostridioides difficile]ERM28230.1 galactose-1-phosphate uridylyltransferase domain protein [Clostridioides difficile P33]
MKELRIDPITNDVVIFATDRLKRPLDTADIPNEDEELMNMMKNAHFAKEMKLMQLMHYLK